jgi:hypothetical protein
MANPELHSKFGNVKKILYISKNIQNEIKIQSSHFWDIHD